MSHMFPQQRSIDRSSTTAVKRTRCDNCGAAVTPTFTRVFGDNNDRVAGCPECTSFRALAAGAAANRDYPM